MNVQKPIQMPAREKGITLVEILLAIGLLVILVGFALPSVGNATARAELKAAVENLEYSIGTARNVARMTESNVTITITSTPDAEAQKISISRPAQAVGERGPDIPDYLLPEGIQLIADQEEFVFDRRGMVDRPGKIILVSRADDAVTSTLAIN